IEAARTLWPKKEIWLIFQPHQYQRTLALFDQFVQTLSTIPVDRVVLTDIFDVPGREGKGIKKKVSSKKLKEAIKKPHVEHIPELRDVEVFLKENKKKDRIMIVMGAGSIYSVTEELTNINRIVIPAKAGIQS
ncbi:MAG: cyanophycin synthetase, partial [bacterium]|nr:cyanophycin synthetase [bacterium]